VEGENESVCSSFHFRFRVGDRSRMAVESVEKSVEDALGDLLQGGTKGLSP